MSTQTGRPGLRFPYFSPLTPLSYLERTAIVHGDRAGVTDGNLTLTYREFQLRSSQLAGAVRQQGLNDGERVAVLSPNSHILLEAHYGIPASGAALVAINTRLAPIEIARILDHSGAKLFIYDAALADVAKAAHQLSAGSSTQIESGNGPGRYEALIAESAPYWSKPDNELSLLSINYTSGTTGSPKGVMYHHRGAYLQSLAMAYHAGLRPDSVYLWTLPMFHTNGWCFPWAVTLAGSRHICLRSIDPEAIWETIEAERVTHLCAAPTVLIMLANAQKRHRLTSSVTVMTGGAPPTPQLLRDLAALNLHVIHLYGLTETFGPAALCEWLPEWNTLRQEDQAGILARQGVGNVISDRVRVVDADGTDIAANGYDIGEIAIRGNNLMLGYFGNRPLTEEAIPDGWFRTGDLAVMHPNGYLEIRDRRKDLIISGGENISSVEVERALAQHPDVIEAAVIGAPDATWGEIPVAMVELRPGSTANSSELTTYLRGFIAGFKVPRSFLFAELPRTSTGKIQKDVVRRRFASGGQVKGRES